MGDARNKWRKIERDERIALGMAQQLAAERLAASLMAPFVIRCRCGWTYHDRTIWNNPDHRPGDRKPRFFCTDCLPADLRALVEPGQAPP